MFICVDLSQPQPRPSLEDPDDCTDFYLEVRGNGGVELVNEALTRAAFGLLINEETATIRADAVRAQAADRVADGWAARFEEMLQYAARKGWLTDDGLGVQAHCVWRTSS